MQHIHLCVPPIPLSFYQKKPPLFFIFMDEFRIFSYLGFTYPTYITVKSDFIIILILNISIYKKSKIKNLKNMGCARHMKEYTIMMYLFVE